ncbi:A-kinase anchor protein 13-like isoform X2 [Brienomyrus brachyistius]|uniref:A-kinase anchor protein 13-like isoform X2 n=1 Tax=Brienomyrus brachyistius TaxID=42636 RepID=UPI0020B25FAE|nr:A-kinase anchor protein 13-like isoform X2 [Brienomyrus brachyistius]
MKLNPQQAPLCGECVLTVQLCRDELQGDRAQSDFYLLFRGSTQRHLASTRRISPDTLQAVCPSHDRCEPVQVTLFALRLGHPAALVAQAGFSFTQDLAFNKEQLPVNRAGQVGAPLLAEPHVPLQEHEWPDEGLTVTSRRTDQPESCSVPSCHLDIGADPTPQETVLHTAPWPDFPPRQPADHEAPGLANEQAAPPLSLAETGDRGQPQHLLIQAEAAGPHPEAPLLPSPGGRAVQHHPGLNTYTLTVATDQGDTPLGLQEDVDQLTQIINQGGPSFRPQSELPGATHECVTSAGVAAHDCGSSVTEQKSISEDFSGEHRQGAQLLRQSEQSEPPSCSGGSDVEADPCLHHGVDCGAQEEKEVGAAPVCFTESRNESADSRDAALALEVGPDPAFSELSWGSRQEETDTNLGTIRVLQGRLGGADISSQEAVRTAERAGAKPPHDNEKSVLGESTISTDMGHSHSQENPGTSHDDSEKVSRDPAQIDVIMKETTTTSDLQEGEEGEMEATSVAEADRPTRDHSDLSASQWGGQDFEGAVARAEHPCPSTISEADLELGTSLCEQSQETAAVDYAEADGSDGLTLNNKQPTEAESVQNDCGELDLETQEPCKLDCASELTPETMAESAEVKKENCDQDENAASCGSELEAQFCDSLEASIPMELSLPAEYQNCCEISTPDPASENGDVLSKVNEPTENDFPNAIEAESLIENSDDMTSVILGDLSQDSTQHPHNTEEHTLEIGMENTLSEGKDPEVTATQEGGPTEVGETNGIVPLLSVPFSNEEEALNSVIGPTTVEEDRSAMCGEVTSAQEYSLEGEMEDNGRSTAANSIDVKSESSLSSDLEDIGGNIGDVALGKNISNEVISTEETVHPAVTDVSKPLEESKTVVHLEPEVPPKQDLEGQLLPDSEVLCNEKPPESSVEDVQAAPSHDHPGTDIGSQKEQKDTDRCEVIQETQETEPESSVTQKPLTSADQQVVGEGLLLPENDQTDGHEHSTSHSTPDGSPVVSEESIPHEEICVNGEESDTAGSSVATGSANEDTAEVELLTSNSVLEKVSEQKDPESPIGEVVTRRNELAVPAGSMEQVSELTAPDSLGLRSPLDRGSSPIAEAEHVQVAEMMGKVSEEEPSNTSGQETVGSGEVPTAAAAGEAAASEKDSSSSVRMDDVGAVGIHRERDTFPSVNCCSEPNVLERKQSSASPESPESLTPRSTGSSLSMPQRDSGSDADCLSCTDPGDDVLFRKGDGTATGDSSSEVWASCSSTDDTASTGTPGSVREHRARNATFGSDEGRPPGEAGGKAGGVGGAEAEEEAKDRLTEVPARATILRSSVRSLSPLRRHSWGPGKNAVGEAELSPRSTLRRPEDRKPSFHRRSYSLEGLTADGDAKEPLPQVSPPRDPGTSSQLDSEDRGSLVSLTEEEQESYLGDCSSLDSQNSMRIRPVMQSGSSMTLPLTKSVSMLAISQKDLDGMRSSSRTLGSFSNSISEEDPGPLRSYTEGKSGTKVSRTFSYLKSKMYRKSKEKDKDKNKEKDKEVKEKEKKTLNGHLFSTVTSPFAQCHQCSKPIGMKDAFSCSNCTAHVHKGCRESLPTCTKVKMKLQKQQCTVLDAAPVQTVTMRQKTTPVRERPRSAILIPEDASMGVAPRRPVSIMPFHTSNLSKSVSISNIPSPVLDDMPLKVQRYLSQSTDSLHKTSKVNESMESLADEGTEMMDSQLLGEFEADAKELEADSWSFTVDKKYLKHLKKDVIKRQDVIYELVQTEMHHLRTLKIMAEVYGKGLQKEVLLATQMVEKIFPAMEDLLELHTQLLGRLLERKRKSQKEGREGGFLIHKVGDILLDQFAGKNAEHMKKVYGKFCSRHSEGVNFYKGLLAKDKRFQAFIKKKMSSTIVRRLSIPECILLVTQRITKYPVLLQRILQHTKESEEDHKEVEEALRLVKEVIAAVDGKVHKHERKRRLQEVHGRVDGRSITRMKSGQMFAREDLVRGRSLLRDGPLQLKTSAGRLKDVLALLLSDVLVFLQEKDQKYIFALLDQRSTVISLQKLIVREVANEERAFFVITAGIEQPEMVEVHANSKEERNTWMHFIQEAMHSVGKDEDEGIPSENEEDRRQLETKAKEMRDLLKKTDEQIIALLEEKVKVFRDLCNCSKNDENPTRAAAMFHTGADDSLKGDHIMQDTLKEVERLQSLLNVDLSGGGGLSCLPRRAETFSGFDSHQMASKHGDPGEDSAELRRTESDGVLKKGGDISLALILKKNSEVLHSVTRIHELLNTLQAVVVQQDTLIEDQRQALSERPPAVRVPSRPSSLLEQEKQRSLEKQRQEAAELQKQQAAHAEERRRRERQWKMREQELAEREASLQVQEEEAGRQERELEESRRELLERKEEYQRDLERLRDAQRKLDRERMEMEKIEQEQRKERTPSSTSEDSLKLQSPSLDRDPGDCELSSSPGKDSMMMRMGSKRKGRSLNPFALNSSHKAQAPEAQPQLTGRLLQLAKTKEKKEKKKKKVKEQLSQPGEPLLTQEPHVDGEIYFC